MGSASSNIPQEKMDDYLEWTYLNTLEIESLYKRFAQYASTIDILEERIHVKYILEMIPQIKYNVFCDRILRVFSSQRDGCFSFEDLLDFFSVMSKNCPTHVKARWAYKIFDFDEDSELSREDVCKLFDRLTKVGGESNINENEKHSIIDVLMKTMDIEDNKSIGIAEFEHVMKNSKDFRAALSFAP